MASAMVYLNSVFLNPADAQHQQPMSYSHSSRQRMEAPPGMDPEEDEEDEEAEAEMEGQVQQRQQQLIEDNEDDDDGDDGDSDYHDDAGGEGGESPKPRTRRGPARAARRRLGTPAFKSSPSRSSSPFPSDGSQHAHEPVVVGAVGKKRGSTVYCDEGLITRLLPFSTKQFNQEIKRLHLTEEEVLELKFARRRVKNARAAHKRRCNSTTSFADMKDRVARLEERNTLLETENAELTRRLEAARKARKALAVTF